jgi:hypothetical protein
MNTQKLSERDKKMIGWLTMEQQVGSMKFLSIFYRLDKKKGREFLGDSNSFAFRKIFLSKGNFSQKLNRALSLIPKGIK